MITYRACITFSILGLVASKDVLLSEAPKSDVGKILGLHGLVSALAPLLSNVLSKADGINSFASVPSQSQPQQGYTFQGMDGVNKLDMAKMLCLINALRSDHGLFPVVYHDKLIQLAQEHAKFQSMHRAVTHVDGAGQIGDRLTRLGFQWSILAENVGAGAPNVTAIMDTWIQSPRHLANMLHPQIRYVGASVSKGYWVQDFAAPISRENDLVLDKIETCPSSNIVTIYM